MSTKDFFIAFFLSFTEEFSFPYPHESYHLRRKYALPLFLLFLLLTGMIFPLLISQTQFTQVKDAKKDSFHTNEEGKMANLRPLASVNNTYLGAYIRGSQNASESNITIQGQLVTKNGTPINNSELEVSIWKNDVKRADVGNWSTHSNGYFNITFNYTAERMEQCENGLPIGNITVNVTAPPQPRKGIGGATKLYNASIYARILNEINLDTKKIPSFENNSSLLGVNRLRYDNTSLVRKNLTVNMTVLNNTGSQILNTSRMVKGETNFTISVGNLPNGNYSLRSSLWLNLPTNNETLNNSWLLGEESHLTENNESAGLMLSNANASFQVLNASKIEIFSIQPNLANRSGDVVEITGQHLNSTGGGTNESMTLAVNRTNGNVSYTYSSTSENCSINRTGFFNWNITVNSSFQVGNYRIRADDTLSNHCVSDTPKFTVKSQLNLTEITVPSERVRIGEEFNISGRVVDKVDASPVTANILITFTNTTDEFSYRLENGTNFTVNVSITTNARTSNLTVAANASFYWADSLKGSISVYNYTIGRVILRNRTYNRTYLWHKRNEYAPEFKGENTSFSVSSKTHVTAAINYTDDFNRPFHGKVSLLYQNTTGRLINNTTFFYPNRSSVSLPINENGTLRIVFPSFSVSISILKEGSSPTNPEGGVSLPFPILLSIGALLSMGGLGLVSFVVFGRSKEKGKERSLESVLEEMTGKIDEGNKLELLDLSLKALKLVGEHFDVRWKESWTPREFFLKLIKSKKTFSYEKILKTIYKNYEEVLFAGEENWERKMKAVHANLVKLNKKLKEEEDA